MVRHAFGTSTSKMAFRLILLELDLEPSVATSLPLSSVMTRKRKVRAYQTVATPYLRDVRTVVVRFVHYEVD
jgi:hypothetical protein